MAGWPNIAALKAAKKALESFPDGRLQNALDLAKGEIEGALAGRYASHIPGWSADCPPHVYFLAIEIAYGLARQAAHTGDKLSGTDIAAQGTLSDARARLQLYETGTRVLVDSAGLPIAQDVVSGSSFNRVTEPVFGMREPLTWGIKDAAAPSGSRLGGIDGFGVP